MNCIVDILFCVEVTEGEAQRALRISAERSVRDGSAMQADAGCDTELAVETVGDFRGIPSGELQGDNREVFGAAALPSNQAKSRKSADTKEKALTECRLPASDRRETGLLEPGKRGVQPVDPRQVQRPRLEAIRHEVRHLLCVGEAAGTAGEEGLDFPGKPLPEQEAADALRAQQSLVAGEAESVNAVARHIDIEHSGALCAVQKKEDALLPAETPERLYGLYCTVDIGGMGADEQTGVRSFQRGKRGKLHPSVPICWNPAELDALLRELRQRTHHGVVLHRGHQCMVARMEQPLQQEIQRHGDILSEDYILRIVAVEETAEPLSTGKDGILCLISALIAAAIDVAADLCKIAVYAVGEHRRLRKGSRGIVQIAFFHPVLLCIIDCLLSLPRSLSIPCCGAYFPDSFFASEEIHFLRSRTEAM